MSVTNFFSRLGSLPAHARPTFFLPGETGVGEAVFEVVDVVVVVATQVGVVVVAVFDVEMTGKLYGVVEGPVSLELDLALQCLCI